MKDLALSIWNIFRGLGSIFTVIRNLLFNTIFLLLLLGFATHYFLSGPVKVPENSALKLSLIGDIVEERRTTSRMENIVNELLDSEGQPRFMVLQDILDTVETAAFDPNIDTILLDLSSLGSAGLDQLQAIGEMLEVFRYQNKKVIAAQDFYTQHQYYLASYADTVIINPMGGVELHGFGSYSLYFKELLDKLAVNYHIFRVGEYKAAIEPITRTSMSEAARSQNLTWLNTLWKTYVDDVAQNRGLKAEQLTEYVENIDILLAKTNGDLALLAQQNKLVDLTLTREELQTYLYDHAAISESNLIATRDYLNHIDHSYEPGDSDAANFIGVIVAEGNIVGGNQPAGFIGSESLSERLRIAREDERVQGVVLRINTAGGSAFAAEIIRQEVVELKKAGKPLVISMGSMAASGGYWISADADQIFASPVTLTGSIGIFGAIPTFERALANIGVHSDGVGTTPIASGLNLTRPLQPEVKSTIQQTVENGYERFLNIVSNGRDIERKDMSEVAEGRIFSGEQAQDLGLVDRLGNLPDAIEAVANLAGITDYSPVYVRQQQSFRDELLAQFNTSNSSLLAKLKTELLPVVGQLGNELSHFLPSGDPQHIYAHSMLQLPR